MLPSVDMARAVRRTVLANLLCAFGYNLIALTGAALGFLKPDFRGGPHAGSNVLVVMNSMRLQRLPDPDPSEIAGRQVQVFLQEPPPNTSAVKAEYQPMA
ncbi:hypothetical protein EHS39_31655 [Ensifer sp. MPMI2T]|nr:hypothetical protein EHS39_31655 [Ensifer sp. MPMI2T]